MKLFRFTIGRFLMHMGLHVMPDGRVKKELTIVLHKWAEKVYKEIS